MSNYDNWKTTEPDDPNGWLCRECGFRLHYRRELAVELCEYCIREEEEGPSCEACGEPTHGKPVVLSKERAHMYQLDHVCEACNAEMLREEEEEENQ